MFEPPSHTLFPLCRVEIWTRVEEVGMTGHEIEASVVGMLGKSIESVLEHFDAQADTFCVDNIEVGPHIEEREPPTYRDVEACNRAIGGVERREHS